MMRVAIKIALLHLSSVQIRRFVPSFKVCDHTNGE